MPSRCPVSHFFEAKLTHSEESGGKIHQALKCVTMSTLLKPDCRGAMICCRYCNPWTGALLSCCFLFCWTPGLSAQAFFHQSRLLNFVHPIDTSTSCAWQAALQAVPCEEREHVHIFFVNGIDL